MKGFKLELSLICLISLFTSCCSRNDYNSTPEQRSFEDYKIEIKYTDEETDENPRLRDSLFVNFENGFDQTPIEIYVNKELKYQFEATTDKALGLASNIIIDDLGKVNTLGIRISDSKIVVLEPDYNQRILSVNISENKSDKILSFEFLPKHPIYE